MNDNIEMKNLEDIELEQVSGGRKKSTQRFPKKKEAKKRKYDVKKTCPRCNAPKLPYRVCPNCGYADEDKYK